MSIGLGSFRKTQNNKKQSKKTDTLDFQRSPTNNGDITISEGQTISLCIKLNVRFCTDLEHTTLFYESGILSSKTKFLANSL